jgi:integrase/recombinase XerD
VPQYVGQKDAELGVSWENLDEGAAVNLVAMSDLATNRGKHDRFIIRSFFRFLIASGVRQPIPESVPADTERGLLKHAYEEYLRRQRGLSERTIFHSWRLADRFLTFRFGKELGSLSDITAADIAAFLQQATTRKPPLRDKTLSSHLRNFFRYLFKAGKTATNLALGIPSVAQRYGARLPRHLTPEQVDLLLKAIRIDTSSGRRNYAMVLLIARLGLRAPEVISIQIDDIDWRAGEITVRGKGKRHDRVPLPPDVGETLAEYIKRDRTTTSRALRNGPPAARSVQEWTGAKRHSEERFCQNRHEATGAICGIAHPSAQSGDESGSARRPAGRDQRHASPPLTGIDNDLRKARRGWPSVHRAGLAGCGRCKMSALSQELDRYLSIRRSLGYKLSTEERILRKFIAFAERENAECISTGLFLRWQVAFGKANKQTWARRLGMVRIFAQWLHSMDSKHEVPPQSLIPSRVRRPHPYIYNEDEIRRIVEAAAELPSINGIRALTCSTLFGLIAVTGLRVSEALSLDAGDIDLENGVVTLRQGKLGKSRLLPVSDCTRMQLANYAKERDRLLSAPSKAFFVSDRGERVTDCGARYSFAVVCQTIGLRPSQKFGRHGRGPRIHDLRHLRGPNHAELVSQQH